VGGKEKISSVGLAVRGCCQKERRFPPHCGEVERVMKRGRDPTAKGKSAREKGTPETEKKRCHGGGGGDACSGLKNKRRPEDYQCLFKRERSYNQGNRLGRTLSFYLHRGKGGVQK